MPLLPHKSIVVVAAQSGQAQRVCWWFWWSFERVGSYLLVVRGSTICGTYTTPQKNTLVFSYDWTTRSPSVQHTLGGVTKPRALQISPLQRKRAHLITAVPRDFDWKYKLGRELQEDSCVLAPQRTTVFGGIAESLSLWELFELFHQDGQELTSITLTFIRRHFRIRFTSATDSDASNLPCPSSAARPQRPMRPGSPGRLAALRHSGPNRRHHYRPGMPYPPTPKSSPDWGNSDMLTSTADTWPHHTSGYASGHSGNACHGVSTADRRRGHPHAPHSIELAKQTQSVKLRKRIDEEHQLSANEAQWGGTAGGSGLGCEQCSVISPTSSQR